MLLAAVPPPLALGALGCRGLEAAGAQPLQLALPAGAALAAAPRPLELRHRPSGRGAPLHPHP